MTEDTLYGVHIGALVCQKAKRTVQTVAQISIKDKRRIFSSLRQKQPTDLNHILPGCHGLTLGEFCTGHTIQTETKRKRKSG
jgi:hypothetical protein